MGMPALNYDASAICQDPNLFLPEVDSKDLVVSVCYQHTLAIGYLAKSRHLGILSDSIKPWSMTLAPSNETIRREIMRKNDLKGKKSATVIWEYQG